jgi:hypothetical protein
MLNDILIEIFERDLALLKKEISDYENEAAMWQLRGDIKNSGGNLALHITGNLRHFVGAVLGGSGYVRDRDAEFSSRNIPREDIIAMIDETALAVRAAIAKLTEEDLEKTYPIEVFGKPMSTRFFLVHLSGHLNYHLGQINYHRRTLNF